MIIITKEQAIEAGLNRYFTGKPCKKGHVSERYVKSKGICVKCSEDARKIYNAENKEKIASLHRRWVKENPQRANDLKIKWAKENKDKVKESRKKTYEKRKASEKQSK